MAALLFDDRQLSTVSQHSLLEYLQALMALHNWGCIWGMNPPVSRSARVM